MYIEKILIKYDSILPFFLNKFDMSSEQRILSSCQVPYCLFVTTCLFVCLFVCLFGDRRQLAEIEGACRLFSTMCVVLLNSSPMWWLQHLKPFVQYEKTFDQQKHCMQFVLLENEATVSLQSPHWMFAWSLRLRSCSTRHSASHALSLQFRLRLLV